MSDPAMILLLTLLLAAPPPMQDVMVVVVNPANPASRLTADQVAQYFLGRSNRLTPLDLPGASPLRALFYQQVAGKDADQVKAIWSKIVFTGRGFPPREYGSNAELRRAVASNPDAIGYLPQDAVDATVKVVLVVP